ncbi:MFS transporter, partial [Rhodococcus sp. NCIMB 12038]|uniref:MFS transporter n=1 Tax=Rhodococcus sp. NCIMB 12038 TaxID=933800 RepID=UPI00117B1957
YGWTDTVTLSCFAISAALLTGFVVWQAKAREPMLPLRLLGDRSRSGSYATMLFLGAGMFATFYFLTLYMQQILGFSPVKTGFAYLPFSLGMGIAATASSKLVERFAPRYVAAPGLLIGAAGMVWFSTLRPDSDYLTHLMPAMFLTAVGLGLSFVPMTLGAVSHVRDEDTGIASALLNTAQQVGGALGLAVLSTIATAAANRQLPDATITLYRGFATGNADLIGAASSALTHGYTAAFLVAGAFFVAGLVITVFSINTPRPSQSQPIPHPARE